MLDMKNVIAGIGIVLLAALFGTIIGEMMIRKIDVTKVLRSGE